METIRSPAPTGFFSHPWRRPPAPLNGGLKNIRNLTAEVAEHAEIEMANAQTQDARGKAALFSALPGRSTQPRGFQGTISALSASSSFILLSSIAEEKGKEESYP